MTSLNYVHLAGYLTRDPIVRLVGGERAVAHFGLAVNDVYHADRPVTFLDIEVWGRTGELCGQYLTSGKPCIVEGRLRCSRWRDVSGHERSKLVVVARSVHFLPSFSRQSSRRVSASYHSAAIHP